MLTAEVLLGPNVDLHEATLRRFLEGWTRELALEATLKNSVSEEQLEDLIRSARSGALVVVRGSASAERIGAAVIASGLPTVAVNIARAHAAGDSLFAASCTAQVGGRGLMGLHWALRHLRERHAWPFETIRYGEGADHLADLRLPRAGARFPVAVLLHGGGWAGPWTRDLMDGLAVDLARRGFASWNLEYRRVGDSGGGWPQTFDDVSAGIEHLAVLGDRHSLDLGRVVLIGHSAGAQLALWAAARSRRDHTTAGGVRVAPAAVVSLAGVMDLVEADRRSLSGEDAVAPLLGGRAEDVPDRYASASPRALIPIGVQQILVQGLADGLADLIDMNARYAELATAAGDSVELVEIPGVDHMGVIDPLAPHWEAIVDRIRRCLGLEQVGSASDQPG